MKQFNKSEQLTFWMGHEEAFKGGVVARVVLSLARRYIGRNALDIGAGDGSLVDQFHNLFRDKKILAIDAVPKSQEVVVGDCTSLQYASNSFDTLFCTDVIEHLSDEDLGKCLREASRVLQKNGYGIFATLNDENLLRSMVTCPECGVKFHRYGHGQVFTEARIKKLFAGYGLPVVVVKKINLHLLSLFGGVAKIFYLLMLDRVVPLKFLTADLFFVVKKI